MEVGGVVWVDWMAVCGREGFLEDGGLGDVRWWGGWRDGWGVMVCGWGECVMIWCLKTLIWLGLGGNDI